MPRTLQCSFCGRSENEVGRLVAGPKRVAICDECVQLAHDVAPALSDTSGDLLLTGIGELVTNDPRRPGALGVITGAAVAVREGKITWVGPESELPSRYRELPELAVEGRAVTPGFVDSHTHLVFAGHRADEFAARLGGATYLELAQQGGGISATVAATRAATPAQLLESTAGRAGYMLERGTTTIEIKSGYGLDTKAEIASLEVARQVGARLPVDVVTTFLGAHVVPPEFGQDRAGYLRLVEAMLPTVARLASYCDVFCDEGAFTPAEAERILTAARKFGLKSRLHANQLGRTGGAELAAAIGAVSADHLEYVSSEEADQLKMAGVVAVLCPTVSWSMRAPQAPGPMLWERGVTVALASDCNPGTSYVANMQLVIAVACLDMGLSLEQALWSATRGGALALEEPDKGVFTPGAAADLLVLGADSYRHLAYRPDHNLVEIVVKAGDVAVGSFHPPGLSA
ncbi:MAG TPA: imidazolonepropionase [Acidimicrobiia bacterium]|nr:imidazolonepropionase [Acidimicrobiia bacterium]